MNPIQAIISAFRNYSNLDGRASREEYWWFFLFFVVFLVAIFIASLTWNRVLLSVWVGYLVVMAPPLWAVTVRRMHDVNRSGRWALMGFMPLMGGPRLTRMLMRPGSRGPNRYGPDPLRPELGGWVEWSVQPSGGDSPLARRCSQCNWRQSPEATHCDNCGVLLQ